MIQIMKEKIENLALFTHESDVYQYYQNDIY